MITALTLLLVPSLASALPQEERPDWPVWRGPDGDGIPKEDGWSSYGREEPAWRVNVGTGYSSVAIAGERLVTLGHDVETGEDRVLCLARDTGEELWRHAFTAPAMDGFHGGGTLTTPAIEGGVVFVTQREGRVMALDLERGEVLWERNLADELGIAKPEYGFAGSPLPLDGRLYATLGGTTVCLDRATGELAWRTADERPGYATPAAFRWADRDCLATFVGPGLVLLERAKGAELGRYAFSGERGGVNAATPVVAGDEILVSAGYDVGAGLVRLDAEGVPQERWRSKVLRNKVSGCTLWEGHVYAFDEAMLKCVDWSSGEERWRVRGLGMGALTVADGRLLVLTSRGELIVAQATPEEFRELTRRQVLEGGVYWTAPVLCDGRLFCRNSLGDLVCLDMRSGGPVSVAEAAPAEAAPLPAAEGLMDGHARAIGGDALRAHHSLRLEGRLDQVNAGVRDAPLVIELAAPDRWRMEYDMGVFGKAETAHDGERAWNVDPFYGPRLIEGEDLAGLRDGAPLHRDLDWRERYASVTTTGRETFDRRDCWAVAATTRAGRERRLYFEVETGLLAGSEAEGEARTTFADYRDFGGVLLPARVTVYAADTGEEELRRIERATWDGVADDAFAMPDAVLLLLRTPEEIAAATAELEARYAAYLGSYRGESEEDLYRVYVGEGQLMVDVPGVGPFPMAEPDAEGRFYFPPTRIYATFEKEQEGAMRVMVMHDMPEGPPELRLSRED